MIFNTKAIKNIATSHWNLGGNTFTNNRKDILDIVIVDDREGYLEAINTTSITQVTFTIDVSSYEPPISDLPDWEEINGSVVPAFENTVINQYVGFIIDGVHVKFQLEILSIDYIQLHQ